MIFPENNSMISNKIDNKLYIKLKCVENETYQYQKIKFFTLYLSGKNFSRDSSNLKLFNF
jgi:hypothetical protein